MKPSLLSLGRLASIQFVGVREVFGHEIVERKEDQEEKSPFHDHGAGGVHVLRDGPEFVPLARIPACGVPYPPAPHECEECREELDRRPHPFDANVGAGCDVLFPEFVHAVSHGGERVEEADDQKGDAPDHVLVLEYPVVKSGETSDDDEEEGCDLAKVSPQQVFLRKCLCLG